MDNLTELKRERDMLRGIVLKINPDYLVIINRYDVILKEGGETPENYKREIEHLKTLAYKDELTGVLNRRGFFEKFEPLFREALFQKNNPEKRSGMVIKDFSTLFIDGDDFKKINDTYGHDVGDDVLKGITKAISDLIRETDSIGRLGGEEFSAVLLGASEEEAYKKAEDLRKELTKKVKIKENEDHKITISVGVASLGASDADNFDELLAYADQAMYEAKVNRGKNNVVRYSEIKDKS